MTDTFLCFRSPESSFMRLFVVTALFSRSINSCKGPKISTKSLRARTRHFIGMAELTITDAMRGSSFRSARSPKKSARNSSFTFMVLELPLSSVVSTNTFASPSVMMKKSFPLSPCFITVAPAWNSLSLKASAILKRSSLLSELSMGTLFKKTSRWENTISFCVFISWRKTCRDRTHTIECLEAWTVAVRGVLYISDSSPKMSPSYFWFTIIMDPWRLSRTSKCPLFTIYISSVAKPVSPCRMS
mmetsp:Transcript_37695/g.63447  ORF Transcript_37695/g.63447 Transcript_37695/m.63447 type:complete len:244 (+) Transcript_37695:1322-2053(+)